MKPRWFRAHPLSVRTSSPAFFPCSPSLNFNPSNVSFGFSASYLKLKLETPQSFSTLCSFNSSAATTRFENKNSSNTQNKNQWKVEIASPAVPSNIPVPKLSLSDKAFFLLAFISCTTSVAFISLVIAAVPTLYAMGRAAISLSKLADTAREELPSTMAAIRLSGMEISDLTLELSDLSQEIGDGVKKSARAVQAAEAGIRQIGYLARKQTMSIIQERASLPAISLQPVIDGAAKKTCHALGKITKSFLSMLSRRESGLDNEDANTVNRIQI